VVASVEGYEKRLTLVSSAVDLTREGKRDIKSPGGQTWFRSP